MRRRPLMKPQLLHLPADQVRRLSLKRYLALAPLSDGTPVTQAVLQVTRDVAVSWTGLRRESEAFAALDGAEIATRGQFFVAPANIGARFFAPIIQWFPGRGNTRVL